MNTKIFESQEDYLEDILVIRERQGGVRSIDIVAETGYSKPSISRAVHLLQERGLVTIDSDSGQIFLTSAGEKQARRIYDRHLTLSKFFINIGVAEKTAKNDACRVEHILSEETYQAIKKRVK